MTKNKADHKKGEEKDSDVELQPQTVPETSDAIWVTIVDAVIKDGATRKKKTAKKSKRKSSRLSRRLSSFSVQLQRQYAVFKVEVKMGSQKPWKVEKEYTDFKKLHDGLKKRFPDIAKVTKFPKKNIWTTKLKPSVVQEQRDFFESYMRAVSKLQPRPHDINEFLGVQDRKGRKRNQLKTPELEDFELLTLIGKGSFGKVFLVRVTASEKIYAMKVLNKKQVKVRRQIEHTKTELRVMGLASHPFIVCLRYAFQTKNRLYMISDFCPGGELFYHLKKLHTLEEDVARFYTAEIALALHYLHSKDIVYRDLKPENVLLDEEGHIKITDFGLSREGVVDENGATTFCGTPEYLSPEMILHYRHKGQGYGKGVDWWSLGTLLYEMVCGLPPFYHRNVKKMCERILLDKLTFEKNKHNMSLECKDIITGFLKRDPTERLGNVGEGFEEIKQHPFFKEIDWEKLYDKQIKPPYQPDISIDPTNTDNFEDMFTREPARLSVERTGETLEADEYDAFEDFDFIEHTVKATAEEFNNDFWGS